jgi:SAM-dependent methyltransferase
MMEWYEAAFDRYYPILYSHRDEDEATTALTTFASYLDGKSPVLDLASGGGRYLEALIRSGHDAYGLDLSHYLLADSVARFGHTGRVIQADMRRLPFADGALGGVLNMFTSFGYFSADTDNLLVFREVQRVLRPAGVFLFDFINAEKISQSLLEETRRESAGYDIHERRRITEHGKYLVKHVSLTHGETGERESFDERLRLYTRSDLQTMFACTGMRIVDEFGDYEGNEFVRGVSERVIVIAERV